MTFNVISSRPSGTPSSDCVTFLERGGDSGCLWRDRKLLVAVFCAALIFNACAPTLKRAEVSQAAIEAEREKQTALALVAKAGYMERLMLVSSPLLVAASFQCEKNTVPIYGFTLHQKNIYEEKVRGSAAKLLGATDRTSVLYVHPGLPAHRAGLRKGDVILRINKSHIADKLLTANELRELIKKSSNEWAIEPSPKDSDNAENRSVSSVMELEVERGDKRLIFTIASVQACNYPVLLAENDVVNAYADGEKVVIHSGLLRFLASDEELALVVAHEISHNTLGHITKKQLNMIPGLVADILLATVGIRSGGMFTKAAGNVYSKEFESEADYSGLYILARAGMDISNAANVWRSMAVEHPGSIYAQYGSSHPSTPERFIAIENTALEIKNKLSVGQELVPNRKRDAPAIVSALDEKNTDKSNASAPPPNKIKSERAAISTIKESAAAPKKEPTPDVASKPESVSLARSVAPPQPAHEPEPRKGCFIKGLVRFNVKIYYTPGDKFYYDKAVDTERGDRMFCSEAEAKEAGWNPAR